MRRSSARSNLPGCGVRKTGLTVTLPHTRVDIREGAADLIEEIARLYGYDRFPSTLLADDLPEPLFSESLAFEERLRDQLADLGLQEAACYALTSPEAEARVAPPLAEFVTLRNPISSDRGVLAAYAVGQSARRGVQQNIHHHPHLALFELNKIYRQDRRKVTAAG